MLDKYIVLNNGVKIPQFGLGTWFIDDDKVADAGLWERTWSWRRRKELWDSKRRNVCCIEGCC